MAQLPSVSPQRHVWGSCRCACPLPMRPSAVVGDACGPASRQPNPAPPPPRSDTERPFGCGALWPSTRAGPSTWAVAPQPVQLALAAPKAGKHSLRPRAPPPAWGTPQAIGEPDPAHVAAPPAVVKECWVPPPSHAGKQSWISWVACPCDVEARGDDSSVLVRDSPPSLPSVPT